LQHVGAVEAGGAHADEQLAVLRFWIGMLDDLYPAVADRRGSHGGAEYFTGPLAPLPSYVVSIRTIG
jgi:hypothetical protein